MESLFPGSGASDGATITALEPSRRNPRLLTLRVDGRSVATLSARAVAQLGLAVGQAWDQALAERVANAAAFESALTKASRWINRRALARGAVADRLQAAGCDPALAERVLRRLEELGLVDDRKLARAMIDDLQRRRPAGAALLRQRLAARGLAAAVIDEVLAERQATDDPLAAALALAQGQLAKLARLPEQVRRRRLAGLLARRGFDADTVERAVEQCCGPAGVEEE